MKDNISSYSRQITVNLAEDLTIERVIEVGYWTLIFSSQSLSSAILSEGIVVVVVVVTV